MPATSQFHLFPTAEIKVLPDRIRAEMGDISGLADSIRNLGLLQPIIVKRDGTLVAGERRFEAVKSLKWEKIAVHFYEELSQDELELVESEENVRRKAFTWKEECLATHRYVETRRKLGLPATFEACSEASHVPLASIQKKFTVAEELLQGNERVAAADSVNSAYNLIKRANERVVETEMSKLDLVDIFAADLPAPVTEETSTPVPKVERVVRPAEEDVHCANFLGWLRSYSGPPFNFIHCDFPYGIGLDESDQGQAAQWGDYEDTPEIFWTLTGAMLDARNKIMLSSCHMIFWFPFTNKGGELVYPELLKFFKIRAPELVVNPYPLIWHKSDGRGIIPDPQRGPRRTYETALLISRGDRKIITPVANSYAAPTARALGAHPSVKPEPMLGYFFRMIVDELTEMLDPTCGSGSALIAAEELKAQRVVGLEMSPKFYEIACENVARARRLRNVKSA